MLLKYAQIVLIDRAKETQMGRYRIAYLKAILRQDVAWYDTHDPQKLASIMGASMVHVESGLSSSTWVLVEALSRFLGSIILGLEREWTVALVAMAGGPFCIYALVSMVKLIKSTTLAVTKAQSEAGGLALESIAAVRTVASLSMEEHVISKYHAFLQEAEQAALKDAVPYGRRMAVLVSTGQLLQGLTCIYVALVIAAEATDTTRDLTAQVRLAWRWELGPVQACAGTSHLRNPTATDGVPDRWMARYCTFAHRGAHMTSLLSRYRLPEVHRATDRAHRSS